MTDLSRFLARYALPVAALSFAAGIVYGRYGTLPPATSKWQLALLPLLTLLVPNYSKPWRRIAEPTAVILLFFMAGAIHLGNTPRPDQPNALERFLDKGNDVILSGRLATAPSYNGVRGKILIRADQLWQPDGSIEPLAEQILLSMPFSAPQHLKPGNRLLVRATLSRPKPPGTPGSFDYRQYLADRGIYIIGHLRSPACLAALHLSAKDEGWPTSLRYWPERARQQINRFIAAAPLSPTAIGLYQALITGELDLVPAATLADFRTSGAFHLLSISGTHLAMLGLLCGLAINLLLRRSQLCMLHFSIAKITAALTILIILLYSLLAGMNPPVVRSLIMAVCLIGALLINRPHSLPNSLGLAMLLSLLWRPTDLFYASFQLSYAAVTGIVILHSVSYNFFNADRNNTNTSRLWRWLLASLAISLTAMLATAPITQYHFRQVALVSPISTILLTPLLCLWSLPLGLVASLISVWFPTAATSLLELGSLGLNWAGWLNSSLAGLPVNNWQPPTLPLAAIPFYYLFIATFLLSRHSLSSRALSAISLTILVALVISPPGVTANTRETRVTFLDVGQGSATLLEMPGGRNILIDGGSGGSEDYDVGAEVIAPFLRHLGIISLEAVVITHDHGDHHNGLATVIDQFHPATVWTNAGEKRSPELTAILAKASQFGATIKVPTQDENIVAGPDDVLTCLSRHHLPAYTALPENRRSLVLRLDSRGQTFLLPGDIMAEDGIDLQEEGESLNCNVLLAPHHGSDNSASLLLAETGRPQLLVVSAGGYEGGNFPGKKLKAWCGQNGIPIHRTGSSGAITFVINAKGLSWHQLTDKGGEQPPTES